MARSSSRTIAASRDFKALPSADGLDLRMEPLADRRRRLEDLVQGHPEGRIHFGADLVGNGPAMFRAADAMGPEASSRSGQRAATSAAAQRPG
jgi:hypothetical protein